MAVRDGRGDVKQTTTGFRGPLMVQSLTSAKSKFLSLVSRAADGVIPHLCQKQIPIPNQVFFATVLNRLLLFLIENLCLLVYLFTNLNHNESNNDIEHRGLDINRRLTMNYAKRRIANILICMILVIGLAGCGGGGSSSSSGSISDVAGTWVGTVEFSGVTYTVTMVMVQGGTTLTATTTSTTGTFAYNGSITGSTIYLLSISGVNQREYNLTLTSASTFSGTYVSTNTSSSATSTSPASFSKI